jgi:hypothetical protein
MASSASRRLIRRELASVARRGVRSISAVAGIGKALRAVPAAAQTSVRPRHEAWHPFSGSRWIARAWSCFSWRAGSPVASPLVRWPCVGPGPTFPRGWGLRTA